MELLEGREVGMELLEGREGAAGQAKSRLVYDLTFLS